MALRNCRSSSAFRLAREPLQRPCPPSGPGHDRCHHRRQPGNEMIMTRLLGFCQGEFEGPDRRCSMGLPVRQRRVLERIENALRGSDPKLAALVCDLCPPESGRRDAQGRAIAAPRAARLIRLRLAGRHARAGCTSGSCHGNGPCSSSRLPSCSQWYRSCSPSAQLPATRARPSGQSAPPYIAKSNLCKPYTVNQMYFGR